MSRTAVNRRQFLRAAAAGAAAGMLVPTTARAAGSDYSIQGVDVSNIGQGKIASWTNVKNSGITFALSKATEGTTFTDSQFATNWAAMKRVGIIRGAYHYGRPGTDAVAQAKYFVNTVKPQEGDLQLVLDLETADGKSPTQVRAWVVAFCGQVQALTHRPPIIYTGFYFWRDQAGNGSNLNCPLWLAAYVSSPTSYVPAAWSTWTFWQYSSSGTVSGINGNVDLDCFNGTTANLQKLTFPRDPLNRK
jgi:lysozyme